MATINAAASTSPSTTFSGLASGIDTASIVDQLVQIASLPITNLQTQQATNTSISAKYTQIKSQFQNLQSAAKALSTRSTALANKGTSSNTAVATVSGTGGSALGSYTINVTQLAQSQRTYSNAFASSSGAGLFGTGTLGIQVGTGTVVNVTIDASDTLTSVAQKINDTGSGVTAGVMFDGTNYRLQVNATATGAANAVTFTQGGSIALGLTTPANTVQAAQDATFTLDNFTIHSATNDVSSALPGVTLSLTGTGSSNISLQRDKDALKAKLTTFAQAYNAIAVTMNGEFTKLDGVSKSADSLSGDGTLRGLQTRLRSVVSQDWSSLSPSFPSLSSMGLALDRYNTISVDDAALTKAVNGDYEGLATLLTGSGTSKGLMAQISDMVDQVTGADGAITTRINSLSDANKKMDDQIAQIQTRIDQYQTNLQNQFTQLEVAMTKLKTQGNALISTLTKM